MMTKSQNRYLAIMNDRQNGHSIEWIVKEHKIPMIELSKYIEVGEMPAWEWNRLDALSWDLPKD
jgi:hypothetical protein